MSVRKGLHIVIIQGNVCVLKTVLQILAKTVLLRDGVMIDYPTAVLCFHCFGARIIKNRRVITGTVVNMICVIVLYLPIDTVVFFYFGGHQESHGFIALATNRGITHRVAETRECSILTNGGALHSYKVQQKYMAYLGKCMRVSMGAFVISLFESSFFHQNLFTKTFIS